IVAQPCFIIGQTGALVVKPVELGLLALAGLTALYEAGKRLVHLWIDLLGGDKDAELIVVEVEQLHLLRDRLLLHNRHRAVALGIERRGDTIGPAGSALGLFAGRAGQAPIRAPRNLFDNEA